MIVQLNRGIRDLMKVKNVIPILAAPDDPLLADASIDRFFICNTWHHIENRSSYLGLMKRMLKPGGQVVMIDLKTAKTPVGRPMEMRNGREDLIKEMEGNGFRVAAEHTALPHQ
ncbi:MAG: class I SAM-dependent methyltransferase [Verrucomicrobiia bacterium]